MRIVPNKALSPSYSLTLSLPPSLSLSRFLSLSPSLAHSRVLSLSRLRVRVLSLNLSASTLAFERVCSRHVCCYIRIICVACVLFVYTYLT